jgi:hypothetical protein
MDCFENIVGFTQTECDCFTGEFTDAAKLSTSGLYMDELPESAAILKAVKGTADCGGKMEDLFSGARGSAISAFKEKLFVELGTRFTVRNSPFTGAIGQMGHTSVINTAALIVGAAYEMKPYKGGVFKVRKLYVGINQSTTVPVKVYKAYVINNAYEIQGSEVASFNVTTVANAMAPYELPEALELPLYDDSAHVVHYLFTYDRTAGFLPLDNKASCGCANQTIVEKWLLNGGIEGADINSLQTTNRKTGTQAPTYGIVVDAEIKCADLGFVCDAYNSNPFIRKAIEYAIQYEAVANLLTGVLHADAVNRFTLTKREQMATDAAILHNKFKSRIVWISETIDPGSNTCFVCNTSSYSNQPYKTGIIL